MGRHIQLVVTDNQPDAEKTQQGVASERQWWVNDLGAKQTCLEAACAGGHRPRHMVDADLAKGTLLELQRRAYAFSGCETRLVELLGQCPSRRVRRGKST